MAEIFVGWVLAVGVVLYVLTKPTKNRTPKPGKELRVRLTVE